MLSLQLLTSCKVNTPKLSVNSASQFIDLNSLTDHARCLGYKDEGGHFCEEDRRTDDDYLGNGGGQIPKEEPRYLPADQERLLGTNAKAQADMKQGNSANLL